VNGVVVVDARAPRIGRVQSVCFNPLQTLQRRGELTAGLVRVRAATTKHRVLLRRSNRLLCVLERRRHVVAVDEREVEHFGECDARAI